MTPTLFYPGQPGSPYANVNYNDASFGESRPANSFDWYRTHAGRLTAQVTSKDRLNFYGDYQKTLPLHHGPLHRAPIPLNPNAAGTGSLAASFRARGPAP